MMKFFKSWPLLIMFVWMLISQGLFILIQQSFGHKVVDSIQGQLRQELAVSNFNFLARSITDFTISGAIECGVLDKVTPVDQRIIDLRYMSKNCTINKWALDGTFIAVQLKSLNGDLYKFEFVSKNPSLFYLALWGFRILGSIAILGIAFAVRAISRSELEIAQRMKALAVQVSHDIRSPLSALTMTLKDQKFSNPEEKLVVLSSLERIQDIANNLLQSEKKKDSSLRIKSCLIVPMIKSVLSEKRYQFQNVERLDIKTAFNVDPFSCVEVDEGVFKRLLSNLINNSVEAIRENPEIIVSLDRDENNNLILSVKDHGAGISKDIIDKVGEPGFSSKKHTKEAGTGIGLSSSIEAIREFGGSLVLNSEEDVGTEIIITLPVSTHPHWLIKEINRDNYDEIWVLDDDPSIHYIWKKKLGFDVKSFASIESFKQEQRLSGKKNILYLIDFELGADQTGLEVITELAIASSSILVTSVFNSSEIQEKIILNKMKMIPKFLIDQISIKSSRTGFYDFVYIDDDPILRIGWENQAEKKKIKLLTLANIDKFDEYASKISKDKTQIYLDSNLGKECIKGEEFAKVLYEKGYRNLNLATGYEKESFSEYSWLNIKGKGCPF